MGRHKELSNNGICIFDCFQRYAALEKRGPLQSSSPNILLRNRGEEEYVLFEILAVGAILVNYKSICLFLEELGINRRRNLESTRSQTAQPASCSDGCHAVAASDFQRGGLELSADGIPRKL